MNADRQASHIEQALDAYGFVIAPPMTSSMWPMLRAKKDSVTLIRPTGALGVGDVALYRDTDGLFVLHRVISLSPEGYILRGDRNIDADEPVRQEQVVAVMNSFYRGETKIEQSNKGYRLYRAIWLKHGWLRRAVIQADALVYRLIRRA